MGRRDGRTLAERVQPSGPGQSPPSAQPPQPSSEVVRARPVVRRHCWVQGVPEGRCPGLLVEWRQPAPAASATPGWEGRVLYVVSQGAGPPVVVEAWLPAEHLSPA